MVRYLNLDGHKGKHPTLLYYAIKIIFKKPSFSTLNVGPFVMDSSDRYLRHVKIVLSISYLAERFT